MNENAAQIVAVAAVLALAHALAPWVRRLRERRAEQTESFAGGMASAYVFLHLLPELGVAHELLGERIYFIVLAGFVAFYGIEVGISGLSQKRRHSFALRLMVGLSYSALIGFTLGEQLPEGVWATALYSTALALHFVTVGNGLHDHFEEAYLGWRAPLLLAAAVLAGAAASWFTEGSERMIDIATASLAGFMLFNVTRDEIPDTTAVKFRWFLAGMLVIVLSVVLLEP